MNNDNFIDDFLSLVNKNCNTKTAIESQEVIDISDTDIDCFFDSFFNNS